MSLPGLSFAEEKISKDTLETLIKGNSVEGKKINWDTTYKMYLDPAGKFRRIDSLGNKDSGEWYVASDGMLCITGRKKEKCRTVKQRSDGGYDVYNKMDEVIWTMDKVSPGNSYNL
jgi:hypothetical protein